MISGQLKSDGVIDRFADMHQRHFGMGVHLTSHFLPWRREMLRQFEIELHRRYPDVDLPYWDSSIDQSSSGPLWSSRFLGQFNSAWKLNRALGSDSLPTPSMVANNQARGTYGSFWPQLEDPIHNMPHRWVGGPMRQKDSARDPVFYLHHAWLDMLWVKWQATHPDALFEASPPINGMNFGLHDPLMEWPNRTPADVLDHHALGYAYDIEPAPTGKPASGNDMIGGESLTPGQAITSANGRYALVYQSDGNLVLYAPWGWLWDSAIGAHLEVQDDGNAVIYRTGGTPVWATDTAA